jgi:predicted 3-demethylubiquinone-9 3-methyltransferase (glyoxalase superfamily)
VKVVEFVLFGQPFIAMSAGPLDPFNHAVSFVVNCDNQAELDRYWNALLEGGSAEQCGWLGRIASASHGRSFRLFSAR